MFRLPLLYLTPPAEGFPCVDLREILHGPPQMPNVQNRVKILPKSLTVWVGCTNVTDGRQTDDRPMLNYCRAISREYLNRKIFQLHNSPLFLYLRPAPTTYRDSTITSRLRTPSLYPQPATHTKCYTSFIHLYKYILPVKFTHPPTHLKLTHLLSLIIFIVIFILIIWTL